MDNIAQITAQVAIEAIANDRDAYNTATIEAVVKFAETNNVSAFYLDMVR